MLQKLSYFDSLFDGVSVIIGKENHTSMDVKENDKNFEVEVDLPGIDPAKIEVNVLGDKLTLKAERKGTFRKLFSETLTLPGIVDSEGILATYNHGVLLVTVPKRAGPVTKKIEVKIL